MSRAFVKENDDELPAVPERPISPHPNLVTAEGLGAMLVALDVAQVAHGAASRNGDKAGMAAAARDMRYWEARRASAQVVTPPADTSRVQFGLTVTLRRDGRDGGPGRQQTFRIVGEDEAEPSQGTISHVSPLARALFGKSVGDVVEVAGGEAEILAIR
jgi:transcription elongation GreA/GreB family factor